MRLVRYGGYMLVRVVWVVSEVSLVVGSKSSIDSEVSLVA